MSQMPSFKGVPRIFPVKVDMKYRPSPYNPKSPYVAKGHYAVATRIVAADGSGDFEDIQEAINDLPSSGGVVYIKEGTYEVSSVISISKSNVSLIGAGKSTVISSSASPVISASSVDNVLISQLFFSSPPGWAIYLGSSSESAISYCWISNCGDNSIQVTGCQEIFISNCFISGGPGIGIESNSSSSLLISNLISDKESGVYLTGDNNIVSSNRILSCGNGAGVEVETSHSIITSNFISDSGDHGIILYSSSRRNIISNNQVLSSFGYGVQIQGDYNLLLGNVLYNNSAGAYQNLGTGNEIAHNITS